MLAILKDANILEVLVQMTLRDRWAASLSFFRALDRIGAEANSAIIDLENTCRITENQAPCR